LVLSPPYPNLYLCIPALIFFSKFRRLIFLRPERAEACLLPSSLSSAPLIGDFFCSRWPGYFLKSRPYLSQPSFFLLSLPRSFSCAARPCHLHGCVLFGRPVCSSPAPKPSARSPSRPSQPPLPSPAEAPYARSSPIELRPVRSVLLFSNRAPDLESSRALHCPAPSHGALSCSLMAEATWSQVRSAGSVFPSAARRASPSSRTKLPAPGMACPLPRACCSSFSLSWSFSAFSPAAPLSISSRLLFVFFLRAVLSSMDAAAAALEFSLHALSFNSVAVPTVGLRVRALDTVKRCVGFCPRARPTVTSLCFSRRYSPSPSPVRAIKFTRTRSRRRSARQQEISRIG
jgi:hypothetical protein